MPVKQNLYCCLVLFCFQDLFDILGVHNFAPKSELIKFLGITLCNNPETVIICKELFFLAIGADLRNMNKVKILML